MREIEKNESMKNPESGAIKGTATYAIPAVEPIFWAWTIPAILSKRYKLIKNGIGSTIPPPPIEIGLGKWETNIIFP